MKEWPGFNDNGDLPPGIHRAVLTVVWNDPVRRRFEKEYWMPLERQVQATQREMERLARVISQARRSVK
ncbi:MAG: hypothetical protein MAG451_01613 [Anaerolineales bacterium]|nr:hypothetical protein [Anaerolineales bacterium]